MITKKYSQLEFETFVKEDGSIACVKDFITGEVCRFLSTRKFGTIDTCFFCVDLERVNGDGLLIPGKQCIFKDRRNVK